MYDRMLGAFRGLFILVAYFSFGCLLHQKVSLILVMREVILKFVQKCLSVRGNLFVQKCLSVGGNLYVVFAFILAIFRGLGYAGLFRE